MTEFVFNESMTEADLLAMKARPGDVIFLSGFLDSPHNSRFDLSRAPWNGQPDKPITIVGNDAVVTATNRKLAGGWTLVRKPTLHYERHETVNLMWIVENNNFLTQASGTPREFPDEWANGEGIWFYANKATLYYKPRNGADANEQILNCSSGRAAFNLSAKRHIHLEGIDASNCHTMEGNILIANGARGISVVDTESSFGSISVYSGEDISLRGIRAHDYHAPIMMQSPKGTFRNILLDGIHVYNCDPDYSIGPGGPDRQAISFRGNAENMRLSNIRIESPVRDGISLYQHRFNKWDGVEVTRCYVNSALDKIKKIHSGGILIGGDSPKGAMEPKDNIDIHHNVVRGCAGYGFRIKAYPPSSKSRAMRVWHNFSFDNGAPDEFYGVKPTPPAVDDPAIAAQELIRSIIANTPS